MSAPTEEEIRDAIAAHVRTFEVGLDDAFTGCQSSIDTLYNTEDFRPTEQDRLDALTYEAIEPILQETRERITEVLGRAGLTFAAEYPDAPRATRTLTAV
jgi:hypothetical protein